MVNNQAIRMLEVRPVPAGEKGEALDLGAFNKLIVQYHIQLEVVGATIAIQHSTIDQDDAYQEAHAQALDMPGHLHVTIGDFSRYVRWSMNAYGGGVMPKIGIDLIAKSG